MRTSLRDLKLNVIFNFKGPESLTVPMSSRPQRCQPEESQPAAGDDCRCVCGSLVARLVEGAVELKCRRCKRTLRVPLTDPSSLSDELPRTGVARR